MSVKLYNFWRSGTSHRLRIALNLKGLPYEYLAVHLGKEAHLTDAFKAINPQHLVPALDTGKQVLIQSPAIIEWLEETHPTPALLPADVDARRATGLRLVAREVMSKSNDQRLRHFADVASVTPNRVAFQYGNDLELRANCPGTHNVPGQFSLTPLA